MLKPSWLYVRDWSSHIHYRDRGAAWIKAHVAELNDYDWIRLPDAQKGQLAALRLLATRYGGRLPHDPDFLASQCGCTEPIALDALLAVGFLSLEPLPEQDASTSLAQRYPHREIERKKYPPHGSRGGALGAPPADPDPVPVNHDAVMAELDRKATRAARRGGAR